MSNEKQPDILKTNRSRMLLAFFLYLAAIMLLYEYAKDTMFPAIAGWESRALAVLVTAIAGTVAASLLLRRAERINQERSDSLQKGEITKEALQAKEELYRSLVESTDDSIYVIDRDSRYLFINKKHCERMGLAADQYQGQNYARFHYSEESIDFRNQLDAVLKAGKPIQYENKSQRDKRYFLRTFSPVRKSDGWITAVTVVSTDITRQKELEESLRALSITDALTGLYNRGGLFALAEQQIKLANRSHKCLYTLYADLDKLKSINDQFGQQEGDAALIKTADILRKTFRESDTIARIGGDEFVVIAGSDEKRSSGAIHSRLQRSLNVFNSESKTGYKLSLNTGIVFYDPQHPVTFEDLIREAERIMSINKKEKK
jgi:diguanylate cyclase (GGDEF)-like protein/PAS domain S-box-containing protein